NPNKGILPSEDSLRADLQTLRSVGFDGLITYGANLDAIPRLAETVGFKAVLLGVWDPKSKEELTKAREAARQEIVLGLIGGNEGLTFHRYDFDTLKQAVEQLRKATGKPVTTTEVLEKYRTEKRLLTLGEFLTVNAHPYYHNVTRPKDAAEWTIKA